MGIMVGALIGMWLYRMLPALFSNRCHPPTHPAHMQPTYHTQDLSIHHTTYPCNGTACVCVGGVGAGCPSPPFDMIGGADVVARTAHGTRHTAHDHVSQDLVTSHSSTQTCVRPHHPPAAPAYICIMPHHPPAAPAYICIMHSCHTSCHTSYHLDTPPMSRHTSYHLDTPPVSRHTSYHLDTPPVSRHTSYHLDTPPVSRHTSYHLDTPCFTSCSYRLVPPHVAPHITWPLFISPGHSSCHLVTLHITWSHIISPGHSSCPPPLILPPPAFRCDERSLLIVTAWLPLMTWLIVIPYKSVIDTPSIWLYYVGSGAQLWIRWGQVCSCGSGGVRRAAHGSHNGYIGCCWLVGWLLVGRC